MDALDIMFSFISGRIEKKLNKKTPHLHVGKCGTTVTNVLPGICNRKGDSTTTLLPPMTNNNQLMCSSRQAMTVG
jgi:hypothetical protein